MNPDTEAIQSASSSAVCPVTAAGTSVFKYSLLKTNSEYNEIDCRLINLILWALQCHLHGE
jgi:hypothetical protein